MSDELRELADRSDAFERCPACGTPVVQLASHRCGSESSGRPNRERRAELAEADPRPDETEVGVFHRSYGNAYAYHDLEEGEPRCGLTNDTDEGHVVAIPLTEARTRGLSPCGSCRRVRAAPEGSGFESREGTNPEP